MPESRTERPPRFFATAPKGMESMLTDELRALGADEVKETRAGVALAGTLAFAYRVCLWSRLANRVLLPLASFPAPDPDALYAGVREVQWEEHVASDGTLAVDFTTSGSAITHTLFGAQKTKDAIVDRLRERTGERPSVDLERPDIRVSVHVRGDEATVSIDLSGDSLHRRGYREKGVQVEAPLKENLAAAVLVRAGWPEVAAQGGDLVDPVCGSGTLLIEGAWMAADAAPGLLREHWGFSGWKGHDPAAWEELLEEARRRRDDGLRRLGRVAGFDSDGRAVAIARANVERAGLAGRVSIERVEVAMLDPAVHLRGAVSGKPGTGDNGGAASAALRTSGAPALGLVVANPPYGQRLGESRALEPLYSELGAVLRERFVGYKAAVFTGNPDLAKKLGLRAHHMYTLYNGTIPAKVLDFDVDPGWFMHARVAVPSPGASMLANRLVKDLKHFGKWARRAGITCFRVYDADLPEYALAIDIYETDEQQRWVHVAEYEAPKTIDPAKAQARLAEAMAAIPEALQVPSERVVLKTRRRQRGASQYEKQGARGEFLQVREGDARFLVNLTDYLDTGLFLDHRVTRRVIAELAPGRRFLNLFAYTGTATVAAALGCAVSTTTVDMSGTYLDWARRNMALNGFDGPETKAAAGGRARPRRDGADEREAAHRFVQADARAWLRDTAAAIERGGAEPRFGLVFLDPPTFSTSKRMEGTFDVQRDHPDLIRAAVGVLDPDGVLLFSTNHRRFRLDAGALSDLTVDDLTRSTLPKDFERDPKVHRVFRITLGKGIAGRRPAASREQDDQGTGYGHKER